MTAKIRNRDAPRRARTGPRDLARPPAAGLAARGVGPGAGRLFSLALALLLAAGLAYAFYGGAFVVTEVTVTGSSLTPAGDVASTVGVLGANVFTVDSREIASRLATLPTVRRAVVWTELPGQLRVALWERQGVLVWTAGEVSALLDEHGTVLVLNPDAGTAGDRARVTAPKEPAPEAGQTVDARVVRGALALAQGLRATPQLAASRIEYQAPDGLMLVLEGGRRVIIGDGSRVAEKLVVLQNLINANEHWSRLDLRDPDRPYYR